MIWRRISLAAIYWICAGNLTAQTVNRSQIAHTYSIVARDSLTGEMGVAVQSHWFSVGSMVTWAEAGIGAIATQSFVNPSFGPRGLDLLRSGQSAQQTVDKLIEEDVGRAVRQLAIVDVHGNVAVYTGDHCIPEAGNQTGKGYSVQANMMLKNSIWPAMARAYENAKGPLAERLVTALEAAEKEGGDIRGRQSAALLIVRGTNTGKVWEDRLIDLRVEDDTDPVGEIKRLLKVQRAYDYMNAGDLAIEKNDIPGALKAYLTAEEMFPENLEMKYWHAVSLANVGKVTESLAIFKSVFSQNMNWWLLTERLPGVGLLTVSDEDYQRIISQ